MGDRPAVLGRGSGQRLLIELDAQILDLEALVQVPLVQTGGRVGQIRPWQRLDLVLEDRHRRSVGLVVDVVARIDGVERVSGRDAQVHVGGGL